MPLDNTICHPLDTKTYPWYGKFTLWTWQFLWQIIYIPPTVKCFFLKEPIAKCIRFSIIVFACIHMLFLFFFNTSSLLFKCQTLYDRLDIWSDIEITSCGWKVTTISYTFGVKLDTRFFYKNVENFWSLWMFLTFWVLSLKMFLKCS